MLVDDCMEPKLGTLLYAVWQSTSKQLNKMGAASCEVSEGVHVCT